MKIYKLIVLFVLLLVAFVAIGVFVPNNLVPFKVPVNNYVKKINVADKTKLSFGIGVLFAEETNDLIVLGSSSGAEVILEFNDDLDLISKKNMKTQNAFLFEANVSNDGEYLAVYLNDWQKSSLILFDKNRNVVWQKEMPEKHENIFITKPNKYIFTQSFDYVNENRILNIFSLDGKQVGRLILDGEPWIKISKDGSLINLRYPLWVSDSIDKGLIFNRRMKNLFPHLKNKKIQLFEVSSDNDYFLGYKNEKLYLINKRGEILWSKQRSAIGNCVFSDDNGFIVGASAHISDKATPKKDKKIFMYDIKGNLLWEKNIDFDHDFNYYISNAIDAKGKYVVVVTQQRKKGKDVFNKVLCINRKGKVVWTSPELRIEKVFMSKDGKWIYAISSRDIYKFENIAIK